MKLILSIALFLAVTIPGLSQSVLVSASEPDAKIIVDGQNLGTGSLKVRIPKNGCVTVKIQKVGFLKYEQVYCNQKMEPNHPKSNTLK